MKLAPSRELVKRSLASHSWIGVMVGALMYLVCLSGTLAVFYPPLERWEQPTIAESLDYDPVLIDRGYREMLAQLREDTHHIYINLPSEDLPRATVSTDTEGWFINADGSLGEKVAHDWTHLLIDLHLYLHLPETWGMILVSMLGALLCGLIVSGFVAHPSIFRDAFSFRLKGSKHLEQADIHNRLSVWAAPFHLMIGITGAFFGLALLMSLVFAEAHFEGDTDAMMAAAYGAEPELAQPVEPANIREILRKMEEVAPEAEPFYITLEDVNTPEQYAIVGGAHENRLIYAEQYRFDNQGEYLDKIGYSDGDPGRQAIFSVYRIHFGHFGPLAVQIVYFILGLALTVVSVSGINIWFAKRKSRDSLNNLWTGIVWGTPFGLALSAFTQVIVGIPSTGVMWAAIVLSMVLAQMLRDDRRSKCILLFGTALMLLLLVLGHGIRFGAHAASGAALWVNASVLAAAILFGGMALRIRRPAALPIAAARSYPKGVGGASE